MKKEEAKRKYREGRGSMNPIYPLPTADDAFQFGDTYPPKYCGYTMGPLIGGTLFYRTSTSSHQNINVLIR